MNTKSFAVVLRNRKIVWGGGLAISFGLIGLPLVYMAISPWVDHSPVSANLMILSAGIALCLASYIAGRIAVAAFTQERITPPGSIPYIAAGSWAVVAVICLIVVAS